MPDVVVLGDSRVRYDVDAAAVAANLSARLGRPVTVGTIGLDAVRPTTLTAIAHRILSAPIKPKVLLLAVAEHQYNRTWDDAPDGPGDQTGYFWQYTADPDLDRLFVSLRRATHRG